MRGEEVLEARKKILDLIEALGRSDVSVKDRWGKTVREHKESIEEIRKVFRERQNELRVLVERRQAKTISAREFQERVEELQDELTELEGRILDLRIRNET